MMHGGGFFRGLYHYDDEAQTPPITRRLVWRVLGYLRPYLRQTASVLALILLAALLELIPPLLYRDLIDRVLPQGDLVRLNLIAVALLAVPLLSGLASLAQRYLTAHIGEGVIFDLRRQMFEHLQRQSLRFFTGSRAGELVSRFSNDVVGAQLAITGPLSNIITSAITLLATLAVMLAIEWRLALVSVSILPLFILPSRLVGNRLRAIARRAMEANARMSNVVEETLSVSGALLVKAFGRQRWEMERFGRDAAQVRDLGVRRAVLGRWFFLGMTVSGAIGASLVYWLGGWMVIRDLLTIGTIVAFAAYLRTLYQPIAALANVRVEFATSLVSFERVFQLLDLMPEIQDAPGAVELQRLNGHLRFEGVHFRYPVPGAGDGHSPRPSPGWALRDVSFEIEAGQLAALVGPSGAGKTTITYLVPRFYDPGEGRILVDGHDLRDVTQESLVRHIGTVTQETYLFHDTLRRNLLYARPEATEEELREACRAAYLWELLQALPQGLDTVVGERGYRLSGGERQRLAIARVILKDPRILILDEATSHLDSQSEAYIQEALERLFHGRTSLVIAHRLSTILAADKILVLDKGRLVEAGRHEELLARDGLYARLYRTQFAYRRGPAPSEASPTARGAG